MNTFARYVCFTYNNPRANDIRDIKAMLQAKTEYACYGVERGAGGTLHLQGYFELPPTPRCRLSTMARWFPRRGAHLEKRRGKRHVAANYCKKGDQSHVEWEEHGTGGPNYGLNASTWEWGELPEGDADQGKRTDIEKVRDDIMAGDIKNEFDLLMNVRSMPALRFGQIFMNNMPTAAIRNRPMVYWIYGSTGTGKSRAAAELVQKLADRRGWSFWRHNGSLQWFDGYNRQEIAWFDDYRFNGRGGVEFAYLLSLLDVYPMRVPIKGGFVSWTPKFIIFTGPKPHTDSFTALGDTEDIGQLTRRISKSFDFDDAGCIELAMAVWTYMERGIDDSEPMQPWGALMDFDSEMDSSFELNVSMESGDVMVEEEVHEDEEMNVEEEVKVDEENNRFIYPELEPIEEGAEGDDLDFREDPENLEAYEPVVAPVFPMSDDDDEYV